MHGNWSHPATRRPRLHTWFWIWNVACNIKCDWFFCSLHVEPVLIRHEVFRPGFFCSGVQLADNRTNDDVETLTSVLFLASHLTLCRESSLNRFKCVASEVHSIFWVFWWTTLASGFSKTNPGHQKRHRLVDLVDVNIVCNLTRNTQEMLRKSLTRWRFSHFYLFLVLLQFVDWPSVFEWTSNLHKWVLGLSCPVPRPPDFAKVDQTPSSTAQYRVIYSPTKRLVIR